MSRRDNSKAGLESETWEWTGTYFRKLTPLCFNDNVFETNCEDNNGALSSNDLTALTPREQDIFNHDSTDRTDEYAYLSRTFATFLRSLFNTTVVTRTSKRSLMRHHQVGKE
jgi:hypothetical protein